jgi:hypothetical protein
MGLPHILFREGQEGGGGCDQEPGYGVVPGLSGTAGGGDSFLFGCQFGRLRGVGIHLLL